MPLRTGRFISSCRAFRRTAGSHTSTAANSDTGPRWPATSTRATRRARLTSRCGRRASRRTATTTGQARGATGGRAGTSSARPWPSNTSAKPLISIPAGSIWSFPITKMKSPRANAAPASRSAPTGSTSPTCWSTDGKCPSRSATCTRWISLRPWGMTPWRCAGCCSTAITASHSISPSTTSPAPAPHSGNWQNSPPPWKPAPPAPRPLRV